MEKVFRVLILVCACSWASVAMASGFVQETDGTYAGNPQSSSAQFQNATTAGNLIVVYVAPGTNEPGTITVSDTAGNQYTAATGTATIGVPSCSISQEFFYAANVNGGSDTVTATTTASYGVNLIAMEYSGVATSSPVDAQAGNSESSSCPYSSTATTASLTTTNANDVIVTAGIVSNSGPTWTAGSGWMMRTANSRYLFG